MNSRYLINGCSTALRFHQGTKTGISSSPPFPICRRTSSSGTSISIWANASFHAAAWSQLLCSKVPRYRRAPLRSLVPFTQLSRVDPVVNCSMHFLPVSHGGANAFLAPLVALLKSLVRRLSRGRNSCTGRISRNLNSRGGISAHFPLSIVRWNC
jgi:hypothetical protein